MAQLTQEQLEEMVVGKPPNPNVVFFERAVLDRVASKEAGRRVYETKVFVKKTYPGVTDWVATEAKEKDFREFQEEYQYFQRGRQGTREPSIEIIPGLSLVHVQELIDYGLATISRLAAAEVVPPHLQYAQDKARQIQRALEGASHGNEEEKPEEGIGVQAGAYQAAEGGIEGHGTGAQQAGPVPAPAGRDHGHPEQRPEPAGVHRDRSGEAPQGGEATGRHHGSGAFQVSPNFDISLG